MTHTTPSDALPPLLPGTDVTALAQHAIDVGAYAGATFPDSGRTVPRLESVTAHLDSVAARMLDAGATPADADAWLRVYVSAQGSARALPILLGLHHWGEPHWGDQRTDGLDAATWSATVGPLGPLAWAAGVPLSEAQDRAGRGRLTADGLRLLAALQGGWALTAP